MIFVLESVNNPIMRKRKTSVEQVQGARWALLLGDREQKLEAGRGDGMEVARRELYQFPGPSWSHRPLRAVFPVHGRCELPTNTHVVMAPLRTLPGCPYIGIKVQILCVSFQASWDMTLPTQGAKVTLTLSAVTYWPCPCLP